MVGATPRGSLELWHRQHCEAKWKRHGSAPLEKAWTSSWQDSLANVKQTMNPCQKQREENMTRHISATPIQCWVMKRDHSVLHVSKYISFRQDEAKQVKTHYTSWTQRETSDFFKIKNKLSNNNNVKKKEKKKKYCHGQQRDITAQCKKLCKHYSWGMKPYFYYWYGINYDWWSDSQQTKGYSSVNQYCWKATQFVNHCISLTSAAV